PFFPSVLAAEMERDKRRDPDRYAHIWMGEYVRMSAARVFKNWTIGEIEVPEKARPYFGAVSVDPTVLVNYQAREAPPDPQPTAAAAPRVCAAADPPALSRPRARPRQLVHPARRQRHQFRDFRARVSLCQQPDLRLPKAVALRAMLLMLMTRPP